MSMADKPVSVDGKVYKWILSCIDVFSRYLLLRPLYSKEAVVVANELLHLYGDPHQGCTVTGDQSFEDMSRRLRKPCK